MLFSLNLGKTLGLGNNISPKNVPDKNKLEPTKAVTVPVKNIQDSTFIKQLKLPDTTTILNKKNSVEVPLALVSSNHNSDISVQIHWAFNETYRFNIKNNDFVDISQLKDNVITIKLKDPFVKKKVQFTL